MNDVLIQKTNGGLGRKSPNGDMISGLVCNGVNVSGGVQVDTNYILASIDDATSLGIDASYDTENDVVVFEHINEFFRINPNGTLYLRLAAQTVKFVDLPDMTKTHAKSLLNYAEGAIRQIAIAFNPSSETVVGTGFADATAAIAKAQELAAAEFVAHKPVFVLIEGHKYSNSSPTSIRGLNAPLVGVVVGQAKAIADTYPNYAAVGTALGALSAAPVNAKISWVGRFNLYGGNLSIAAIGGTAIASLSDSTLDDIDTKGGIFFRTHVGRAGLYFNASHAADAITSDYAFIENSRTMNKAARLVREALLPWLESPQKIDPVTGKLSPEVVKFFESLGRKSLEEMLRNDEVSGLDVFVDPDQDLLATSQLDVKYEIIPTGSASKIVATIGFKNPF